MDSSYKNQYSWIGVLEFLQTEYQKGNQKQNTWALEKKTLQNRIAEIEGELRAANVVASDLMKRNKMLEYCLRQQRSTNNKEFSLEQVGLDLPPIPQRKPRSNKSALSKILTSLGIKDIFQEIEREVNLNTADPNSLKHLNFEKQVKQVSALEVPQPPTSSNPYKPIQTLLGHNDGVRDLFFNSTQPIMVSVSQDCLMKVWDTNDFSNQNPVPYSTIRTHTGPIFTVSGSDQLLFTGGMEGIIRAWTIPVKGQMDPTKCLKGSWQNAQEDKLQPVWQLLFDSNKIQRQLYSTSSDDIVKVYDIIQKRGSSDIVEVSAKLKQTLCHRPDNSRHAEQDQIISAICFPQFRLNTLAVGYIKANELVIFDRETSKTAQTLKFSGGQESATNKIAAFPGFLVSAHEDKYIRVFDNNRLTHDFIGHTDSVSGICALPNGVQFLTSSHDGTVKQWDTRKFECVSQHKTHLNKHGQSIHCVSSHKSKLLAASGGADAIIKIYSPKM